MKGVVYLDGGNAVGKSYLASKIRERHPNSRVVHCTYRFGKIMWHYHLAAFQRAIRFAEHGLAILDRNWISEEIYGHFYRNGTAWPHQGRIMQKLFLKHAVVTVMCIASPDQVVEQIKKHRAENYHSPEFLKKPREVAGRYIDLYFGKCQPTGYDSSTRRSYVDDLAFSGGFGARFDCLDYHLWREGKDEASINGFLEKIEETLDFHRGTQYNRALNFGTRNIAGHLRTAKYVFVGDKVNYHSYRKCWPFMAYANSTLFMAEAMHLLNLKEEEFMWTNAECEERHVDFLWNANPRLKFIALGQVAHRKLHFFSIPHCTIPHPSFGRRFMGMTKWSRELQATLQP
jgi:hypothetical protein